MSILNYERSYQARAAQKFAAAIENATNPTEALTTALTQDAERLLAPDDPNVRAHTAEDGTVVTEVHLLYGTYRNSRRHEGNERMVNTTVNQLQAYVLTRNSRTDGSMDYAFGRPGSEVHHPSNIKGGKLARTTFFSWGADGNLQGNERPAEELAEHAWRLRNAESWNPNSAMIIQGLDGDRLTDRNALGRLGAIAAEIRRKWGERIPFFSDLE